MTARKRDRGSILLLSILFLFVLFLMAVAFLGLLPSELREAGRQRLDTAAAYAADAAVVEAIAWLEHFVGAGRTPGTEVLEGSLEDWKWKVRLTPDSLTSSGKDLKVYKIEAVSSLRQWIPRLVKEDDRAYRKVTTWVRQESFARFGVFYDTFGGKDTDADGVLDEPTMLWIVGSGAAVEGPMHINSPFWMRIRPSVFAPGHEDSPPIFRAGLSTAGFARDGNGDRRDGVGYWGTGEGGSLNPDEAPYDTTAEEYAPLPERYQRLYSGGQNGLKTSISKRRMPGDPEYSSLAWGEDTGYPASIPIEDGVYIPSQGGAGTETTGGVYIRGEVVDMELKVELGNQVLRIAQDTNGNGKADEGEYTLVVFVTDNPLTLTEGELDGVPVPPGGVSVPVNHTVLIRPDGVASSYRGITNGLIYSTHSIKGLSGVNKGRKTIAVEPTPPVSPVEEEHQLYRDRGVILIDGDITREDTPVTPGEEPPRPEGDRDVLGLIAYDVLFSRDLPRDPRDPTYIYAGIFAGKRATGGGIGLEAMGDERPGDGMGRIYFYGSQAQGEPRVLTKSHGPFASPTGYDFNVYYDKHLAENPPPFWPSSPKFQVMNWQEENLNYYQRAVTADEALE